MDYEAIKRIAKEAGCSVSDLLALTAGNDPFYVGAPAQLEKAQWFAGVYRKMGSPAECHIRRVHYWLVSQALVKPDGAHYENTERDWQLVTIAAKYARYLGLVPVEKIVDRRNPPPQINHRPWDHRRPSAVSGAIDAEQLTEQIVDQFYPFNPHATQAYLLEIWCEKSTMNDVLEPICRRYGVNLVTGLGELSITAVYQLSKRITESGKPARIFYVSDFDPAGECMPVSVGRKVEFFIQGGVHEDVKLLPLMLTASQCEKYDLPRTPIKETERRRDGFEGRHGQGATELDALEALRPGEMRDLVEAAILDYFDIKAWNAAAAKNRELQDVVRDYLRTRINGDLMKALDLAEFDEFKPPIADLIEDGERAWLYDSDLDYIDQLHRYKQHQRQSV